MALQSSYQNNGLSKQQSNLFDVLELESLDAYQSLCGIDEAGRGSVAGSLFVCGVILSPKIPQDLKANLKDSKTLSQKRRDELAPQIKEYCQFHLVKTTAYQIDKMGLSLAIRESLLEIMANLKADCYCFDGNCNFQIPHLQTLIKGDLKIPTISAASILAKNAKDSEMQELHKIYPQYHFDENKGYGTKAHLQSIKEYGYCPHHRKSYKLKALQTASLNSSFLF